MVRALVSYTDNRATPDEIAAHLYACDRKFSPPLTERVVLDDYARKIAAHATRFEAWADETLAGLAAIYCDDPTRAAAFVTNVSVLPAWQGGGIATQLLDHCRRHVSALGFARIELDVTRENQAALALYHRCGYAQTEQAGPTIRMVLNLRRTTE